MLRALILLSVLSSSAAFNPAPLTLGLNAPAVHKGLGGQLGCQPPVLRPVRHSAACGAIKASMLDMEAAQIMLAQQAAAPATATQAAPAAAKAPDMVGAAAVDSGNIMMQVFGSDSLPLTIMATITLIAGIVLTAGVGALTFFSWKDNQELEAMKDPNSDISRALSEEMRMLENPALAKKKAGSKAMAEINEMQKKSAKPPPQNIPSEPGNRDARRNMAKRKRMEDKQTAKREAEAAARKQEDPGLSSLPADSDANKGFLDNIFK